MRYYLLTTIIIILASCDIPSADTADFTFLQIDQLEVEDSNIGFRDVWLFRAGQTAGVYELPRKIPVLSGENVELVVRGGIRENGINSMPRMYPFTAGFQLNTNLLPNAEISISERLSYFAETKIRLDGDFETKNEFGFDEDGVDTINIRRTDQHTGSVDVPPGALFEEATQLVYAEIPRNGSPVYLEIEYRGNVDLDVGLIGVSADEVFKEYFVSLRSEEEWKKAYINFTDLILASNLPGYQVVLGIDNTENANFGNVEIDNIKLLHF